MNISFSALLLEAEEATNIRYLNTKSFNHCEAKKALCKIDAHKNIKEDQMTSESHTVCQCTHNSHGNPLTLHFPLCLLSAFKGYLKPFALLGYFHYTK